jgi:DNA-binding transcriptional MerR regulator
MEKTADAFRTISEVAEDLDLPQHVLRFWETRFVQIKPLKRGGGRRYYRREDIDLLRAIRQLLYSEGYTIKGVQKILKEQGTRAIVAASRSDADAGDPQVAGGRYRDPLQNDSAMPREIDAIVAERDGDEPSFGPPNYQVLEQLLNELNECERLLGAARAA